MKITGLMVYYYFVCKRKLWYFANNIGMEQNNEDVAMGKLIDENSYIRDNKHLNIDGTISIDFIHSSNCIHEIKKSKSVEDAGVWQVKYYLYYLEERGADINEAVIDYPLLKQRNKITLTDDDREVLNNVIKEITEIIKSDVVPKLESKGICKKCAYYELCFV